MARRSTSCRRCCPSLESVSLVVAWFGDDLRAGALHASAPRRRRQRQDDGAGIAWSVAGLSRGRRAAWSASVDGRPAYGGTPSDASVIAAIHELKARGLKVTLYPFIMMDVPAGNALPDPIRRGRPAGLSLARPHHLSIRRPASPARPTRPRRPAAQVAAFFGAARRRLRVDGDTVTIPAPANGATAASSCTTPHLCAAAGGVDAFLHRLGAARPDARCATAPASIPFVAALVALAADVRAMLGPGDEAHLRRRLVGIFRRTSPADGSGDVHFHLDPLWASSGDRLRRHRQLHAARRLARRRRPSRRRPAAASIYDLDYLARQRRRRRRLRLVLRQRRRPRRAGPHADHRRRLRQALGVPLQGPRRLVAQRRTTTGPAASRSATPTAWVPRSQADLVHRDSAARRSTRAPTSRTSSPIRNRRRARLPYFSAAGATTSCQRALSRAPSSATGTPRGRLVGGANPRLAGLWRADGRPGARSMSGPGTRGPTRPFRSTRTPGATGQAWGR